MSVTGSLPWDQPPKLDRVRLGAGDLTIVRDDLLYGGSKARFLRHLLPASGEVVFGGPFCGGAPVALSAIGRSLGLKVTLFYAARNVLHPRQVWCQAQGARLRMVRPGYMTNVQKKARDYAREVGAMFLPLGFDLPAAEDPFVAVMESVRRQVGSPDEVWCATGSGMLARCLARAFPSSHIQAVAVGLASRWKRQTMPSNVTVTVVKEALGTAVRLPVPPFPACEFYERKAWREYVARGRGSALFWNVIGT